MIKSFHRDVVLRKLVQSQDNANRNNDNANIPIRSVSRCDANLTLLYGKQDNKKQ